MNRFSLRFLLALTGLVLLGMRAGAQTPAAAPAAAKPGSSAKLPSDCRVTADSLEYYEDRQLIVGSGHVLIEAGPDTLQADHISINTLSQDVYARGNVVVRKGGQLWELQEARYNLLTKQGNFGQFTAYVAPYYLTAKSSQRISTNEFYLEDVTITTCEGDEPEFLMGAKEARLKGDHLRARGVTFYYHLFPFLYWPYLSRNLSAHDTFWEFLPGASSRHGVFLLSAYNYPVAGPVRGRTRFDLREKRGLALGQDFLWSDKTTNKAWRGEFDTYYLDDQKPFRSEEEKQREQDLVDSQRYRIRLSHVQNFDDRDYGIAELNYVSDPDVTEDFFNEEFRHNTQPENRVSLTHRGDRYSADLLFNGRLNDFYENINRLPEVSLDVQRTRIGESGFYYDSESSAGFLQHVYPETDAETDANSEDYDTFRLDTLHTVYYPTRNFGFLNVIPRAGYRGTFYSATREVGVQTNTLVVTDTNGVSSVTTQFVPVVVNDDPGFRSIYELGVETSFKAFRTWDDLIVLEDGDGLRHVVEPYANYTWNPEPNLRPYELPQFDSVDGLDLREDIKFGVRNKLQTRRKGFAQDIVDANVFTTYYIDQPDPNGNEFGDIGFDVELRLAEHFPIDFDGSYDTYDGSLRTFNAQVGYLMSDASSLGVEYRYRRDKSQLLSGELVLFPHDTWSFQIYGRYDADASRLEEHSYYVSRKTSCVGYGVGLEIQPGYDGETDDYQAWFRIWLLAFPNSNLNLGGG